ncbi:hypothetical protein IMSHALPRED_001144 [Imshaugia aleurites]|uniref:Heterokaryon incompatibility domain-containing protein n=1 Tax=Imshaugia aleurites TaxID=172621 RepID=A0A8H3J1E4_9LECA|nr:hypothetical protein IMSHALPRED_001144 [Imshaugia aleurites]
MTSQDVYAHAPLATPRREIRILVLAPGTDDNILRGDLIVESLNYDDLHYTALSYTWSGPVSERAIIIDGVPFRITENLKLVLLRIRGPTRPKNVWVDAICINQDDLEEKNVQVHLMGDIFASATRTVLWLGEKSADSDVAMDFIGSLRQRTRNQLYGVSAADPTSLRAVTDLMRRKWWTRIWVIQEALMSRRIVVQCGAKQADIVNFVRLVDAKELEGRSLMKYESEQPNTLSEQPFIGILREWYAHRQQIEAGGLSLRALMPLTHGFQASLRKDRIFALLGLATPDARSHIIPDYSDAVPDRLILTRLTMYFLRDSIEPLRSACHCRAIDCPSWVTDWMNFDGRFIKSAALPSPGGETSRHDLKFEPPIESLTRYQEPSTLLVHGMVIDRVQIAVHIPSLHGVTSYAFETQAESIKARTNEWVSAMVEYLEAYHSANDNLFIEDPWAPPWWKVTQAQILKASLITYIARAGASHSIQGVQEFEYRRKEVKLMLWYQQLRNIARGFLSEDDMREAITNFEVWVQHPSCPQSSKPRTRDRRLGRNTYETCNDTCVLLGGCFCVCCVEAVGRSEWLGQDIVGENAGRTLFLTERGWHFEEKFAVHKGDIICWLSHPRSVDGSVFVLRESDRTHWTLIGHFSELDVGFVGLIEHLRESAAKREIFRLR